MIKQKKIATFFIISSIMFFVLSFYSFCKVNSLVINNTGTIHNSFISDYDISNSSIEDIDDLLNIIEKDIINREVTIVVNNLDYKYTLSEIGVSINKEELKNEILQYENRFDYWELYNNYSKNSFNKKIYDYKFQLEDEKIISFLNKLKTRFDKAPKDGALVMQDNRELKYINEVIGYSIDLNKNIDIIKNNFMSKDYNSKIVIEGNEIIPNNKLKLIDTKISSFTTTFDDTVSRKYNLIAGAKLLDGKIMEPGEEFSFFENAGPYTGINGYVYYLGVMGNGVCQVATTLYNAELLAGLTTIERYNHGKKSVYVDGGLDATVAVTSGIVTDFRFKNSYDYPVYISAFVDGDKLTVEMWSNNSAKNGIEYKTESVKLGYGTYKAYRHAYKDEELIDTEDLGYSYYFSE